MYFLSKINDECQNIFFWLSQCEFRKTNSVFWKMLKRHLYCFWKPHCPSPTAYGGQNENWAYGNIGDHKKKVVVTHIKSKMKIENIMKK